MIYGPVDEAKRIKGYEITPKTYAYEDDNKQIHLGMNDTGEITGTTSIGRGGILDSVAQHRIKELDIEKEREIMESSNVLEEYSKYISGKIIDINNNSYDKTTSQLEKRMAEDLSRLLYLGVSQNDAMDLIASEYYGGKYVKVETEEDIKKANDTIKTILRMRSNYVNRITQLLSKMLRANYRVLGLSEEQATTYINSLKSKGNDSVRSASEVLDIVKANADKYAINNGEGFDLRPLGLGCLFGPHGKEKLDFIGTDGSNKDGVLSLLQKAVRYDAVVVSHGGDDTKKVIMIDSVSIHDVVKMLSNKAEELDNFDDSDFWDGAAAKLNIKYRTLSKVYDEVLRVSNVKLIDSLNNSVMFKFLGEPMFQYVDGKLNNKQLYFSIENIINKLVDDYNIKEKINGILREGVYTRGDERIVKFYKENMSEIVEYMKKEITSNVYKKFSSWIDRNYVGRKIERYWHCQPTKTLHGGPFEDVNDVVRQLIKEGFKKICIEDCNPGGHKLADDIMKTKGILINHSDFSNYVESGEIWSSDPNYNTILESEQSLIEFAESYGIDYNDDEYLTECCNWYLESLDYINEGTIGEKLLYYFKKIIAAIIGFFKKIFDLVKRAFNKIRSLFRGTKEEPKDVKSNFQKPIKVKMFDIKKKKITEVVTMNREDLEKEGQAMCNAIAQEIKNLNQKQQRSLKNIERDVNTLDRKENDLAKNESSVDILDSLFSSFDESTDLLEMLQIMNEFDAADDSSTTTNDDEDGEEYSMDDEAENTEDNTQENDPQTPTPDTDDEAEEYSMDDEANSTEEPTDQPENEPAPQNDTDTGDDGEEYSMDDEGDSTAEEQPQPEADTDQQTGDADEGEEYELPDEDGEGSSGSGDGADATQGDTPSDGDDGGEEYSMDDDGGDSESGSSDPGSDSSSMDDSSSDSTGDDKTSQQLKDLETIVFDELSDAEKKMKLKELKSMYENVYIKCGKILDIVSDIKRDEETTQIVEYISNTLIDLKQYVIDYLNNLFDTKTYAENLVQLQRYLMIFTAINKVFAEIRRENNE